MNRPRNIDREQLKKDLGQLPDAANRADVELLANSIRALPENMHTFFAQELVQNDLMRFQDPFLAPLIDRAREQGVLLEALTNMFHFFPAMATDLVLQAADHCDGGSDAWNADSAGGWSQEELVTAYCCLYVARDGLTIPFGSNVQ